MKVSVLMFFGKFNLFYIHVGSLWGGKKHLEGLHSYKSANIIILLESFSLRTVLYLEK